MSMLPPLAESRLLRFSAFGVLYAAQGLPMGLLGVAVPAYLAEQGSTAAEVSTYMGIIALPWSLKLINGAIMDRWSFLSLGRRRPWVLIGQMGMIITSLVIAFTPNLASSLSLLTALGFVMSCCTALQDVAVDGMAVDLIPVEQQPRANAMMWGGKTLGGAGATAAGAWIIEAHGLNAALFAQAVAIAGVMLVPLLARERPGERLLPWSEGQASPWAIDNQLDGWRDIGGSLLKGCLLPASLFATLAIFSYSMATGLLDVLLPLLTVQKMGWVHTDYSELNASARLVGGVLGMVTGGVLVERLGRRRTITACSLLLVVGTVAMGLLATELAGRLPTQTFVVAYFVCDTLAVIAFLATFMALSWKRVAATQFSLYMALSNLGYSAGAALFGPLEGLLTLTPIFYASAAFLLLAIVLLRFVDMEEHLQRLQDL